MLNFSNIKLAHGARVIFSEASFFVRPGDKIGLVGLNGSGKTTVFKLIAGLEDADDGSIVLDPGKLTGYFSQDVGEMSGRSALQEVLAGAGRASELGERLAELENKMEAAYSPDADPDEAEKLMTEYGEVQHEYMHLDGYNLESRAKAILEGLGIGSDRWNAPVESFSGGWKMRIALGRILLLNPDLLLMDEPTNHLDIESIIWLEAWLKAFKGALIMTSHDREFMTRICSRTLEAGGGTLTMYSGDYDFYLREREIRREQLVASYNRQQAMLAKEEEFIARFAARASHAAQVQSRVKTIEKIERIELPKDPRVIKFRFEPARRSGDIVVNMENLAKAWKLSDGSEKPVFSGISGVVKRLNKIALTGVNGAGKSTLLKIITGQTEASSGKAALGESVDFAYFSQYSCELLNPDKTVYEELEERLPAAGTGYIKNLLGAFLFSGDDVDKKISVLSGGEKSRVVLASMLAKPLNFLVLDEPTNHLDITSREVLLDALKDFDGTVLIVSHDRYFLKHFVNRVFEIDHGKMNIYEGDYNYYLDKKAAV
jgi:ATP-binding cassette subfamily F protein 3